LTDPIPRVTAGSFGLATLRSREATNFGHRAGPEGRVAVTHTRPACGEPRALRPRLCQPA